MTPLCDVIMNAFILHHWDTDGIMSACIVAMAMNRSGINWTNAIPEIGIFALDDTLISKAMERDIIYILDLNIPQDIKKFNGKRVIFIDHHQQEFVDMNCVEYHNPVATLKSSDTRYPSASWVAAEIYNIWTYHSAIGAIGDNGSKVMEFECSGRKIKKILESHNLGIKDALKLVKLIDSNYVVMDHEGVIRAVEICLNTQEPRELLDIESWNRNLEMIDEAVACAIDSTKAFGKGYAVVDFQSPYNIISIVARKLVWDKGYKGAIAINRKLKNGIAQVYFRISKDLVGSVDIPWLVTKIKEMGANAGGKSDVMGVVCNSESVDNIVVAIKRYMGV